MITNSYEYVFVKSIWYIGRNKVGDCIYRDFQGSISLLQEEVHPECFAAIFLHLGSTAKIQR